MLVTFTSTTARIGKGFNNKRYHTVCYTGIIDVVGVILINPGRVSSCTSNGIVPFRFWVLAIMVYCTTVNGVHPHAVVCVQRANEAFLPPKCSDLLELRKFCAPTFVSNT